MTNDKRHQGSAELDRAGDWSVQKGAAPPGHVDFQALFNGTREPYLVLDPKLCIITANEAYLAATMTRRESIVGKYIFDVFPDSPDNARAGALPNLEASLHRVLATREAHRMGIQRYDIPLPDSQGESFCERFWRPVNTPVFDSGGALTWILHQVEDVTDLMRNQQRSAAEAELLADRARRLEAETLERAQELERLNVELLKANNHRDLILNSVADAIVAVDHEWRITYLNDKARERLATEGDLVGRLAWDIYPEEKRQPVGRRLLEAMRHRKPVRFDHYNEPNQRWTENRIYPSSEGLVIFSTDVTQRKRTELNLQAMRTRLRMAMRVAKLGFWEMDLHTGGAYFSPECRQQLGYSNDEFPDEIDAWLAIIHPDDASQVQGIMELGDRPDAFEWELEYRLRHKDGDYRWMYARFMLVQAQSEVSRHLVVTHLDVTERKKSDEQILHSAHHDTLTDLPNRTLIYDYTEQLIARKRRTDSQFALLFLDLDRFKPINDLYGHKMGDRVLQIVSERLAASVRAEDFVGRLAGDEFIVVLPDISEPSDAGRVAEHIMELMTQPFQINGYELRISPSVGISVFPGDGLSVDALIQSADAAMYQSKESGRNNYHFFEPSLYRRANETLDLEQRMRRSLERGEFELFYQPILDTRTQAIVAVEALLRWFPDGVPGELPEQFLPVAETTGLMKPLGDWIFREACEQQQRWVREGLSSIPIAINVSPVQLLQRNFYGTLAEVIQETGIAPESLIIELTETSVMKDTAESAKTLKKLKDLGLKIALDDFGTGYSSLSHLSHLPIDILKIDKSFTQDVHANNARNIVKAILSLGQTLGLSLIAEGVQCQNAFQLMQEHGCHQVQGHLFCKPLTAAEFAAWYARAESPGARAGGRTRLVV